MDSDNSDTPWVPASRGPEGETMAATATSKCGWGVRAHLQPAVAHGEPVGLAGDRLIGPQQRQDRLERLLHHAALVHRVDAEHERVAGQGARSGAEDQPAASEVVEQHQPVGHQPGVVVGEGDHARPQHHVARPLGGGGDEHLRAGDDLVATGVVLAEPDLVVAVPIEGDHAVEVVLDRQGRVLADRVERGEERAETQRPRSWHAVHRPGVVRKSERFTACRPPPVAPGTW
jgi:hypothetical protein